MEHGNDAFFNCPVSYTILLGPISDSVLPLDAMINAEHLKLSGHVFPALIIAQRAHPSTCDILSPCLECSKGL
jgi:hypothetical protein